VSFPRSVATPTAPCTGYTLLQILLCQDRLVVGVPYKVDGHFTDTARALTLERLIDRIQIDVRQIDAVHSHATPVQVLVEATCAFTRRLRPGRLRCVLSDYVDESLGMRPFPTSY
jgi:hypothetical protein